MRPQEGNKHQKHTLSQMKIQYALVSCNADPRYTAYWPTTAAAWLKLGITPVCLFIPDNTSKLPPVLEGSIVRTIPPLSDVHIMPQVQMLRFWASCLYPDAVVIISDMDFVPLSRSFFHTQLAAYPEHAYIHVEPNPTPYPWTHMINIPEKITHINKVRYLRAWFHIAKGRVMHRVLKLTPDWETTCKKTTSYSLHRDAKITIGLYSYRSHRKAVPFFGDEIYPSLRLHHSSYSPIYCISYQLNQYSGLISHIIPLISDSINTKRERFVGIHLPWSTSLGDADIAEHLFRYGTTPNLPRFMRWYIRFWNWLINSTDVLSTKVKYIGPWISIILIMLIWCLLRILPPIRPYNQVLLILLWNKRFKLLRQAPQTRYLLYSLLRIKNILRPK